MADERKRLAKRFCELYYVLYSYVQEDYYQRTGTHLKSYKPYEPNLLENMFLNYRNRRNYLNQLSNLLSSLMLIQALPNANHRTAFLFVKLFAKKHGISMRIYEDEKEIYDKFYRDSKRIIAYEISHDHIFDKKYFDVHHSNGIKEHGKISYEIIEEITETQSGMDTVESLHSFIASVNQDGSFPS